MRIELTAEQIERCRIENEIVRLRAHVHPMPTAKGIAAHQQHIQDLIERLRHLPPVPRQYLR